MIGNARGLFPVYLHKKFPRSHERKQDSSVCPLDIHLVLPERDNRTLIESVDVTIWIYVNLLHDGTTVVPTYTNVAYGDFPTT